MQPLLRGDAGDRHIRGKRDVQSKGEKWCRYVAGLRILFWFGMQGFVPLFRCLALESPRCLLPVMQGGDFLRGIKKKYKKRLVRCCRNKNKYYLCSRFGRETVLGVKKETTSSLKILEKGQASIKKQFLRDLSGPKDIQDL